MSSTISFGDENHGFQAVTINGSVSNTFNYGSDLSPSFFKTSKYESYKNVNPERVPHTCSWFLEHATFQRWKASSTDDLLWLSADPGCGKSVLSRALIDERLVAGEATTLCYFFFKDNEEQNKSSTALCALLHQLLCVYDSLLQKHVAPAIKKYGDGLKNEVEELWRVFLSVATDPSVGHVICILDALDECRHTDRDRLIKSLERFYTCAPRSPTPRSTLKIIVTSRPYNDIERCFYTLTEKVPTIRLAGEEESDKIGHEIGIVVDAKVRQLANKRRLGEEVRSALQRRLSETPNRTYLWLHLTLDQVEKTLGSTSKKLVQAVNTLPTTVEEAYEKILVRCNREETTKVLQIIVAAQRPLTLSEIDEALEIDPDSQHHADLDLEGDEKRRAWIRTACGLFVTVVDSRVFLIHQTAREFLVRKGNEGSHLQEWRHSIDLQTAHQVLAEICVTYLLLEDFDGYSNLILEHGKNFALLDYAASHWISHAQEANINCPAWVSKMVKLCDIDIDIEDHSSRTWFRIYRRSSYLRYESIHPSNQSALYWATVFGLVHVIDYLLKSDLIVKEKWYYFTIPLQAAAKNEGRGKELVMPFLDLGEKVKITEKVLEAAARNSSQAKEVMELLLKQDKVEITEKVLKAAASNLSQAKEVMELLLKQDKVEITEVVLEAAARNSSQAKEVMELLLKQDKVEITEKVLKAAASNLSQAKEVMELLLKQDKVEITEVVLEAAARNSSQAKEVMELLLKQDKVEITEVVLKTAARNSSQAKEVMGLLLKQDKVEITEKVLEAATSNWEQGREVIELLLKQDKVEITEKVLEAAARNSSQAKEVMELLLKQDKVEITEKVLEAAASNWGQGREVIELLLQQDKVEITEKALEAAARNSSQAKEVLALLLEQDKVEITERVLETAARNESQGREVIELLLKQDKVKIIERVLIAAAENQSQGREIIAQLLKQLEDKTEITEKVAKAVMGNQGQDKEIIKLLLRKGEDSVVTYLPRGERFKSGLQRYRLKEGEWQYITASS